MPAALRSTKLELGGAMVVDEMQSERCNPKKRLERSVRDGLALEAREGCVWRRGQYKNYRQVWRQRSFHLAACSLVLANLKIGVCAPLAAFQSEDVVDGSGQLVSGQWPGLV